MKDEALRLADWLDGDGGGLTTLGDCAAELRRLVAQRDALLEALKSTRAFINSVAPHGSLLKRVNAAIKAVGEGK